MRTNIVIDDELMKEAQAVLGTKTKRQTVERALERAIRIGRQQDIIKFRGKLRWEGNLDAMRTD